MQIPIPLINQQGFNKYWKLLTVLTTLLVTLPSVSMRFLSTQTTGSPSYSRNLQSVTYSSTLACGDCILGNYTYCVKGPQQYTGTAALSGYCCKDNTCAQVKDAAWNCSSQYTNVVDKFKVCPFNTNQCGSSVDLNLGGIGDSQCIRIKGLKQGNACLFKVQSKCGVPNFQLNDTSNVVIQYRMISNTTISTSGSNQVNCTPFQNQPCFCQPFTNATTKKSYLSCNCQKNNNITLNTTDCQCMTLKDSTGATVQSCNCTAPAPVQVYLNQTCRCQKVTNPLTKVTTLNCNCSSANNLNNQTNLTLEEKQCKCTTATDPVTKQSYQSCNCSDIAQCPDPKIFLEVQPPPCQQGFPCQCLNKTNATTKQWYYDCSCTKQAVNMTANGLAINQTSCAGCSPVANGNSWFRQCSCCLTDVQQILSFTPPITCPSTNLKEKCQCNNVTAPGSNTSRLICNCSHPDSKVTVQNLNLTSPSCECEYYNNKSCNCCVSYDVQAQQLQPTCLSNSVKESCQCLNNSQLMNKTQPYLCSCMHPTSNVTTPGLYLNTSQCYCHPNSVLMKDCNCCAPFPVVVEQLQPKCLANSQKQSCSCANVTVGNVTTQRCNCTHPDTKVLAPNLTINANVCYCNASTSLNKACNCCVEFKVQEFQLQPQCKGTTQQQSCKCTNVTIGNTTTQRCDCTHPTTNITVQNLNVSASSCYCNASNTSAKFCNCCMPFEVQVEQLQPQCAAPTLKESCACVNGTSAKDNSLLKCSCAHPDTKLNVANLVYNISSCYCNSLTAANKACNCCAPAQAIAEQLQPQCTNNSQKQNCQCTNVTVNGQVMLKCDCTHNATNVTVPSLVMPLNQCYCNSTALNRSCNCCVSFDIQVVQRQPKCDYANKSEIQGCQCQNVTVNKQTFLKCDCNNSRNNVTATNLVNTPENCYCVSNIAGNRFCNCCTPFEVQVAQLQPKCVAAAAKQSCQCLNTTTKNNTWSLNCSCANDINNGTANNLTMPADQCYCSNNLLGNKPCNCCVSASVQIDQLQPVCMGDDQKQDCQCVNTTQGKVWSINCECRNPKNNITAKNLNLTKSPYYCVNNLTGSKFCNACVPLNVQIAQLQPQCSIVEEKQLCSCSNFTKANLTHQNCSCSNLQNSVPAKNLSMLFNSCYCNATFNGSRFCNCCVSQDVQIQQLQPTCAVNSQKQNCSCVNVTVGKTYYLNCSCQHPQNNISAPNTRLQNPDCFCLNQTNTSKRCNCCVPFDVQLSQLQPQCSATQQKQGCQCLNYTSGKTFALRCDCNNTVNNVTASNLNLNNQSCYCNDTLLGNKFCNCCVNGDVVTQQMQPVCNNSVKQKCSCLSVNGPTNNCNCTALTNSTTVYRGMNINSTACYCDPTISFFKSCNCCVTAQQMVEGLKLMCLDNTGNTSCKCANVTTGTNKYAYNCNCTNKQFWNTVTPNITVNNNSCECTNPSNNSNNLSCNCCLSPEQLVIQPKCAVDSPSSLCLCKNVTDAKTKTSNLICDCAGTYNKNPVIQTSLNFTQSNCGCLNSTEGLKCNCCVQANSWQSAKPICPATNSLEGCKCSNVYDAKTKIYSWSCNCSNSLQPRIPLNNISNPLHLCGCANSTTNIQDCNCCINPDQQNNAYLSNLTCPADSPSNNCSCVNISSSSSKCTCLDSNKVSYKDMIFNKNQCTCLNETTCKCCLPTLQSNLAPQQFCPNTYEKQFCSCQNVTDSKTKITTFTCQCTNSSTNKTTGKIAVDNAACGCITSTNNKVDTSLCNCCIQTPLTCPVDSAPTQQCDCQNVTNVFTKQWQWDCSCTRKANNISGNFTFDQNTCRCNNTKCNCCITKPQEATQVPRLYCNATFVPENCSCVNVTDPKTKVRTLNCSCQRDDNKIFGNFSFNPTSCLCPNATYCNCCVSQQQYQSQIPVITCNGTDQKQGCACRNLTNSTTKLQYLDCKCQRPDTGLSMNFSFNQPQCLCLNSPNCDCCVAQDRYVQQVQCNATTQQQACSCRNVTDPKTKAVSLDCNCTRKDNNVTSNFTFAPSQCMCNTTFCNCCLSFQQVATQIPVLTCPNPVTAYEKQNCTCVNKTNSTTKKTYLECQCTKASTGISRTFSLTNDICLCNTTNCACCVNQDQQQTQLPFTCSATTQQSNCACKNVTVNKVTTYTCDCTTKYANNFTIYNTTLATIPQQNCSCENSPNNCTCCFTPSLLAPTQPKCAVDQSPQGCACNPIYNPVTKLSSLQCNCTSNSSLYYNSIPVNTTQCGCQNVTANKTSYQNCACCISQKNYVPPEPTCPAGLDYSSQPCSCVNVTNAQTKQWNYVCNCTNSLINAVLRNSSMNKTQCGCVDTNDANKVCKCCLNTEQQRQQQVPQCPVASQPYGQCNCTNVTSGKTNYLNCTCSSKVSQTATITADKLIFQKPQCGCWNDTYNGKVYLNCSCCMNTTDLMQYPAQNCSKQSTQSQCLCSNKYNNATKQWNNTCDCNSPLTTTATVFQSNLPYDDTQCGCKNVTNGTSTYQQCSCCVPTVSLTPAPRSCQVNTTNQVCQCLNITDPKTKAWSYSCNCTSQQGNVATTTNNVSQAQNSCSCLNATLGLRNFLNCTCCVNNPPPTQCELLAVTNSSILNCNCSNSTSGKYDCDACSAKVNATTTLSQSKMQLNSSSCCCVTKTDPLTKKSFQSCNCTQTAKPVSQNCNCTSYQGADKANYWNCSCTDCNRVNSSQQIPSNKCTCATSTATVKNCTCSVDFAGICPVLGPVIVINEGTCDAANKPQNLNSTLNNATNCKFQYEYYVAVVASGKDSSILMQLQSYQLYANYLKATLVSAILLVSYLLY